MRGFIKRIGARVCPPRIHAEHECETWWTNLQSEGLTHLRRNKGLSFNPSTSREWSAPFFYYIRVEPLRLLLVRSLTTGLVAIWIAPLLSQWKGVAAVRWTPRSDRSLRNQTTSLVAANIAQYSASALIWTLLSIAKERSCFLLFQEIREFQRKTQSPVVERRSIGQPAFILKIIMVGAR